MRKYVTVLCSVVSFAGPAMGEVHFDLWPSVADSQIQIGGSTHASTENPFTGETGLPAVNYYQQNMRVFGYELGEDPLFPTAASDPGINAGAGTYTTPTGTATLAGTGLPLNSQLSVNFTSDLTAWTGSGFATVPDLETLTITFGNTRTLGTGTGILAPLPVKTFTSSDEIHLHLEAELARAGGTPTPGIYLFSGTLSSSDTSIADSDPFYVVYNFGLSEESHEASIEWAESNLVPEPGVAAALLMLTGLVTTRRRKPIV